MFSLSRVTEGDSLYRNGRRCDDGKTDRPAAQAGGCPQGREFHLPNPGPDAELLQAAATAAERSLSEEIEWRLEHSFEAAERQAERNALVTLVAGGGEQARVLQLVAETMWLVQAMWDRDAVARGWTEKDRAEMLRSAVNFIFANRGGLPEELPPDPYDIIVQEGRFAATSVLNRHGLISWPAAPTTTTEQKD